MLYRLEKKPVLVLAATALLSLPIMPAELWLVKTLIDRVQGWSAPEPIGPVVEAAAWLALLMVAGNIALGVPMPMAQTRLQEIGTAEGQRRILQKTERLPLAAVESPLVQRMRERATQVSFHDAYHTGIQLLQSIAHTAALLGVLLVYGMWVPAAAVCVSGLLMARTAGRAAEIVEEAARKLTPDRLQAAYYGKLLTSREAAKEIRLFGLGELLAGRWRRIGERQLRVTGTAVRSAELRKLGPGSFTAVALGLLVSLLALLPGAAEWSAGDFSLLFLSASVLVSRVSDLIAQGAAMRTQRMRWEDYRAYEALDEDAREHRQGIRRKAAQSGLQLRADGLEFRYPGAARNTIDGVGLTIPPGCRIALVGENGSGKSTLVKLLTGLYAPTAGEVVWMDGDGKRLSGADEGGGLSAVFQDFAKLYVTLRENVALGDLSAIGDDDALLAALRQAGSRRLELDAPIGAPFGGFEPSGGEWQKIVTARLLLRRAGFVFFDEPTAALDPMAEKEAFETFMRVTEGKAALLVTHRLGAAKLADRIVVMKDGKAVEQGTHEQLMARGGEYARMFRMQASWYA
ncbi:ABC transporter ATP-binding protein [Paenibacillus sp. GYB003]|uniref:ABC transporter ATP-binding protein n=1 Tax=Paenibacillus sp. GYB003 TaxID=2994392 RepID=UPI002F963BF1